MDRLLSLLFLLFVRAHCSGQTVAIVNQHGHAVGSSCSVRLTSSVTKDAADFKSQNDIVEWILPKEEAIYTLTIDGMFVQPYCNQYSLKQLNELDTVAVFESNIVAGSTPVFLVLDTFDVTHPMSPEVERFKEFLTLLNRDSFELELAVYHTWPLTGSERVMFEKLRKWLCAETELPGSKLKLAFTDLPYTCSRHNFFSAGTVVSKEFVGQQPTAFMEDRARGYTLVGQILITKWVWAERQIQLMTAWKTYP
jgi:hypothetical protein